MTAAAVLARLIASGCRVTLRPDGRISLRPAPALLAEARQHRDELARLCAPATEACSTPPRAEALPAPRNPLPGALPGDPPAPVVDPEASYTLTILELAGAQPGLRPDGQLGLAHPELASPDLRATARQHQDDIASILAHRALLERLFPVSAEPLPPEPQG